MPKLKFLRKNIEVTISSGSEFLEIFKKNPDLPMKFGCTRGECGVCAIKVIEGCKNLTKCSSQERDLLGKKGLSDEHRLACQCAVNGDITLE